MLGGGCWRGSRKWMLERGSEMDAGEGIRNGCWKKDQKWMPRETKDRVQGRTVKINKKRIGSDSCIFWERRI